MNSNSTNENYHDWLVFSCAFYEFLYSLPFEARVEMDLYQVKYQIELYPKELRVLSIKELEKKLNSIEKPWWNDMYEEIDKDKKLLQIIYNGGCNLDDLQILYKASKSNNTEIIDSMEKETEIKYKNTITAKSNNPQRIKTKKIPIMHIIISIVYIIAVVLFFYYYCIKK